MIMGGRFMSVREKILGAEARWVMGRVMAGDFLDGVDKYLQLVAPEREKELSATIRARAGELAEADKDMIVDRPSEGALGIGAAVLASFETLLPLFDGDERRAILVSPARDGRGLPAVSGRRPVPVRGARDRRPP